MLNEEIKHNEKGIQKANSLNMNPKDIGNPIKSNGFQNVNNVSQYGNNALNIGTVNGNVYVSSPRQDLESIARALCFFSNLRHSNPTLKPIIYRETTHNRIINWISEPVGNRKHNRVGFITGNPGVGKTAFTNILYSDLSKRPDYLVLGLKVDQISFTNVEDLSKKMNFDQPLTWVINEIKDNYKKVVVIIDQIDALSLSLSSDRTPLTSIVNFIRDLNEIKGVRVLVSCRDYDIEYDPILSELSDYKQRWRLGDFSREEVIKILSESNKSHELSDPLLNFLGNPLNLSMYLKIRESDITISPLNINSLYDIVWKQDVLNYQIIHKERLDLIPLINELSESMHNSQRISEPLIRYESRYFKEIDYLTSCGFLKQEGMLLQFSHQTLFDYVYARRFVESGLSIIEELKRHHQGLFIRSQTHSVLLFLRSHDHENYISSLNNILSDRNPIKFHIKVLALTLIAFQSPPLESEIKLLKNKIWDNYLFGKAFLNALNSKEWFDAVLELIKSKGGWNNINPLYPEIIIRASLRSVDLQFKWAIDVLKEIIIRCGEAHRDGILSQLENRHIHMAQESLKEFYKFLKNYDENRFYPKMLENLIAIDASFVSSEIINYVNILLKESNKEFSYRFNIGYEWDILLRLLKAQDSDKFLELTIQLVTNISEATQYEHQIYDIKLNSVYYTCRRNKNVEISHCSASYLYNSIINDLVFKKQEGKDIESRVILLLNSKHTPLVCAALNVLLETCTNADNLVYEIISGKKFLTAAPPWVQYYAIELLKKTFPLFDENRQKKIIDNIMSIESSLDKMNVNLDAKVRMEHGIPISYHGWERGVLLNSIPEDLLKCISKEASQEFLRLKRKFKRLDNSEPSRTESMTGWPSLSKETVSKMGTEDWKKAMKKYNTDICQDFKTPTLSGQCKSFQIEVANNPNKFMPLIIDIFDDDEISMKYLVAGIEGLIVGGRIEKAAMVTDRLFNQWLKSDINKSTRDFSLHDYLFAITNVFNNEDIDPVFFDSIRRIVLEADDSKDMENFSGSDILTHAINTTRGNACEQLVLCGRHLKYRYKIFDVLEKIAPEANVSTRAAALINLALLNHVDKNRNVRLFKALLHDYNPLLMSMPLHNLNPLAYFVRYAFDQLTDFFDKVVETPESHRTQINVLWLAHRNHNPKAMSYIKTIKSINPDALPSLVSFFSIQGYYDSESINFVNALIKDLPVSKELATQIDSYLDMVPDDKLKESTSDLDILLQSYSESELIKLSNYGYLNLLKNLSVIEPKLTLKSLNTFIDTISEQESYKLNNIVEILINSYNAIRKYNDPDDEDILDKAIDHMDTLLMQASGPSYLNNYINHIDNG